MSSSLPDSSSLHPVYPLYGKVSDHANTQDARQDIKLGAGTDEVAVGKGDGEAKRLPHSVIGECRFGLGTEQAPAQGCKCSTNTY